MRIYGRRRKESRPPDGDQPDPGAHGAGVRQGAAAPRSGAALPADHPHRPRTERRPAEGELPDGPRRLHEGRPGRTPAGRPRYWQTTQLKMK